MGAHVLQVCSGKGRINIFITSVSLWRRKFSIEVAGQQQLFPVGLLADGRDDRLYVRGIVWDNIAPHGIPALPSQLQLKN